jgi:hypothetical protein
MTTRKFRKKTVVIEAFKWLDDAVPKWWEDRNGIKLLTDTGQALIPTLEGVMKANPGDWIIKGVKGEIYPVKNDIFVETYEPVEEL